MKTVHYVKSTPSFGLTKFITHPIQRNPASLARELHQNDMPLTEEFPAVNPESFRRKTVTSKTQFITEVYGQKRGGSNEIQANMPV